MMKTDVMISAGNGSLRDVFEHSGSVNKQAISSEVEILSSFLRTSARYLGIDTGYCPQKTHNPSFGKI